MDKHSKEVRSYNMSRVRSKNTKPEETVRKFLFRSGFRYRKNVKGMPGSPDIVLPKYRTVIFVNGCFWHMHEKCGKFVMPVSNTAFWRDKLQRNKQRDEENYKHLHGMGWKVITVWECELKKGIIDERLQKLLYEITVKD